MLFFIAPCPLISLTLLLPLGSEICSIPILKDLVLHGYQTRVNVLYPDTLVPEALCEAKKTRREKEEPLVASVVNPTSTLDLACEQALKVK